MAKKLTTDYGSKKNPLLKRLNRVEGQLRGISRMVAQDSYSIDVLTQISAAQAALDKTALEIVRIQARYSLSTTSIENQNSNNHPSDAKPDTADKHADEIVRAVQRLISR